MLWKEAQRKSHSESFWSIYLPTGKFILYRTHFENDLCCGLTLPRRSCELVRIPMWKAPIHTWCENRQRIIISSRMRNVLDPSLDSAVGNRSVSCRRSWGKRLHHTKLFYCDLVFRCVVIPCLCRILLLQCLGDDKNNREPLVNSWMAAGGEYVLHVDQHWLDSESKIQQLVLFVRCM